MFLWVKNKKRNLGLSNLICISNILLKIEIKAGSNSNITCMEIRENKFVVYFCKSMVGISRSSYHEKKEKLTKEKKNQLKTNQAKVNGPSEQTI